MLGEAIKRKGLLIKGCQETIKAKMSTLREDQNTENNMKSDLQFSIFVLIVFLVSVTYFYPVLELEVKLIQQLMIASLIVYKFRYLLSIVSEFEGQIKTVFLLCRISGVCWAPKMMQEQIFLVPFSITESDKIENWLVLWIILNHFVLVMSLVYLPFV